MKKSQNILALFLILLSLNFNRKLPAANIHSPELSELFEDDSLTWKLSPEKFIEVEANNEFIWNSAKSRNSARSTYPELKFLGMKVFEANAYFKKSVLSKMIVSLYNRGDVGWVQKENFEKYLTTVKKAITEWTKRSPKKLKPKRRSSKIKINKIVWVGENTHTYLEWSSTEKHERNGVTIPFRSEFVRIRLVPAIAKGTARHGLSSSAHGSEQPISYFKAKSNVTRNARGDIFLKNVPMVNQGDKSYCAVASVSRVMGYYGKDVDQHEIAQMVETSYLGTNPELMVDLLKKLSFKLGIRIRTHQHFEFGDLVQTVKTYNKLANRNRKQKLVLYKNAPLTYYYQEMDTELLTQMKTKKTAVVNRFIREVRRHINIGIPLAWSVILGKIQEHPPLPQAIGAHMRLIIGYNPKNSRIIYTDSWGAGHEFKHMEINDAVTITLGLYTIEPRSRRL